VNPEAHDAYLKGRYFFDRPSDENLTRAIAQFDEAVNLDPNFAPAYSGLSDAFLWAAFNEGAMSAAEAMPLAKATAEKAIELDDISAEGHTSLAVLRSYEFDWVGGEREFRRALSLNPNYALAHHQFGIALAQQGRFDEALAENQRATKLAPFSPPILIGPVITLAYARKYEAAKQAAKALEIDPTVFFVPWVNGWIDLEAGGVKEAIQEMEQARTLGGPPWVAAWLGYAYGVAGDNSKALAMIEELKRRSLHGFVPPFNLAMVYLGMGDRESAMDGLENAYAAHSLMLTWLKMDPVFDPLRSEPRFIALLKKVHLEE
jgi:tetratricopeptide (TPR) repeat protein